MPTNAVPIARGKSSPPLPAAAVEIYRKMIARTKADDEWQRLHNLLVDILHTSPHIWPLLPAPGEEPETAFQRKLVRKLEAALREMEAERVTPS